MFSLVELQSMPEVPAIAHFCSLFSTHLDLIEFEIDDFETALLKQNTDDIFSSTLVERLVVKLVTGCLPMYASRIHDSNFSKYLCQLIQTKKEEAEEEGHTVNFEDPFEKNEVDDFSDLCVEDQVRVIYQLTEFRLECDDIPSKLKDLDPEGLRIEPIGVDSNNVSYWYFYGTRLYKEVKERKVKKAKNKKGEEIVKEDDENGDIEEIKVIDPPGWYLVCNSEGQWTDLAKMFKKSKKKQDKELSVTLNENFLPDILKMYEEKEKEERMKLLMANKRSSSRLDRKREQEEKAFMKRMEEERKKEMELKAEEAKRKQKEKENKLKSREQRANQRAQMGLRVGNDLDTLMANRKRIRESSVESGNGLVEPPNQTERRKNPAMREFQRLTSVDEDSNHYLGKNLRL